jgi:hypothetical protein
VCASCHGVNQRDQVGRYQIKNEPAALRQLLLDWKAANPSALAAASRR